MRTEEKEVIKANLQNWEVFLQTNDIPTFCQNLPLDLNILTMIQKRLSELKKTELDIKGLRYVILGGKTVQDNMKKGFSIVKHLILVGKVRPSKVTIASLNDCYSSARGFGEGITTRRKIFNRDNDCIIITGVQASPVYQDECIIAFWQDFFNYCQLHPKLNVILCCSYNENPKLKRGQGERDPIRWYKLNQRLKIVREEEPLVMSARERRKKTTSVKDMHTLLGFERI